LGLLSVDFGTSNTTAAFRDARGAIRDVPLSSTGSLMPSAVLYTKGRMLMVGDAALQAASTDPLAFEPAPKRRMPEPEALLAGMFVPVTDLVAGVLAEAIARATEITGERPREVMLTYPDQWGPALQQKLATAGEAAGIDVQRMQLVGEAAAAAAFYTATGADFPTGARVTVFDFGGGTCGVAVLDQRPDGTFTVVAADGLDGLGGLDLEARIHGWVLRQLSAVNTALAAEFSDITNAAAQLRLADAIRSAKEALSSADSAAVELSGTLGSEVLQLTRAEFDRLISADIERAVRLTESVLYQANTIRRTDDPVTIHLTGGSSRIPLIQTRLAALGRVDVLEDPKTVLTHGALRATPPPQDWQSIRPLEPLPTPIKRREKRRSEAKSAAPYEPERSRRRIRITSRMRKWAAGVALVAIAGSGVGVAAVMIFGSIMSPKPSEQAAATPRTTLAPPTPKVPTAIEFTIGVVVTDTQCPPGENCQYKYTIEPKYVGLHPLPETPFTVHYEVRGGVAPQPGEFTVTKDQAKILKDVVLEGLPDAKLQAVVMNVTG
jgi:hypothetical protein